MAWTMQIRPWMSGLLAALALICLPLGRSAVAQEQPRIVKVGVYVSPPFVVNEGDGYSGMAFELWSKVATDLKLVPEYHEFQNYRDLVQAVTSGVVEVAVTNLSITAERAQSVDFTHPWFDAGLRIMVMDDDGTSFWEVIEKLNDAGHLETYAWIAFVIFLATTFMTLFDRQFDAEFPKDWREGLAESFYHVMSIATSGKSSRKNLFGWTGRIWQGFWMVCGVAVIAYITSSITSVMTAATITNRIHSAADLQGKTVGARTGSLAEGYMRSTFGNTVPFDHLTDAVNALNIGEVAAVVGDAPVLEFYAHSHPALRLKWSETHFARINTALPSKPVVTSESLRPWRSSHLRRAAPRRYCEASTSDQSPEPTMASPAPAIAGLSPALNDEETAACPASRSRQVHCSCRCRNPACSRASFKTSCAIGVCHSLWHGWYQSQMTVGRGETKKLILSRKAESDL